MNQLEHPAITRTLRTGYPNVIRQPEHNGTDWFGDEILEGDEFVEYDGFIVLKDNLHDTEKLEKVLAELGFEFKTAI